MKYLMGKEDTYYDSWGEDYTDKVLVLKPEALTEPYREAKYQLFVATGGFGCEPGKLGTAVFGHFVTDNDEARFSRTSFIGIATEEAITEWNKLFKEDN